MRARVGAVLVAAVAVLLPSTASAHHTAFVDTSGGPFADDASWLAAVGVSNGCDDAGTRFCGADDVTRGELAAFLVRALELPDATDDPFTDDAGGPFDAAAAALAAAGITSGCEDDAFCPARPVTRSELAVMLARALDLPPAAGTDRFADDDGEWFEPDVERLVAAGITQGCATDAFCPRQRVTRGELSAFLRRGLEDVLGPGHAAAPADGPRLDLTVGSDGRTEYRVGEVGSRSGHGNRIYCAVSHFSYDDPIVRPDEPGSTHLHMFVGATDVDAYTRPADLLDGGASSCEGGSDYRSSWWTPALLTAEGEPVVPEQVFAYYKTFLPGDLPPAYDLLQVVPQGLQLLATTDTLNAWDPIRTGPHDDGRQLRFSISFPSCVATEDGTRTGRPILDHRDMPGAAAEVVNSHVAYPGGPDRNALGCPASHPYRFPTPILNIAYDAAVIGEGYRLSSDLPGDEPLSTLHADYVFGVAPQVNEAILRCTVEARSCGFGDGRGQLPDRFLGPDGEQVYRNSVTLADGVDRTPFGVRPPMHGGHG